MHSTAQHSTAHLAENLATQQSDQQAFLNKLDADLWKAADKLRQQLDAANYKHIVLGLIFLKYVSDSFSAQQDIIKQRYTDPTSDFYLDPTAYSESELADILNAELEERQLRPRQRILGAATSPLGRNQSRCRGKHWRQNLGRENL